MTLLWFRTADGLLRFDGISFTNLGREDGLRNMRQRALQVRGSLELRAAPGRGSR
jgi:signal transduction histidine kinase